MPLLNVPEGKETVELPDTLTICSDEDLLTRFCKGQTEAFGALVRRYERELYGYLRRYLGDASLAEDVFQNTFLQVYVKSGQYEPGRPVRPWLYTIATNQAIDALRRNGRHQALSLDQQREELADGELSSLVETLEGAAAQISCNLFRAACSRDFTVPTGMPRMSAISRYFRPW